MIGQEMNRETWERIYKTDIGDFAVKDHQSYNRFDYYIRKLSGNWPEDKHELGRMVHHYYNNFGGSVTIGKDTAHVIGWGAD